MDGPDNERLREAVDSLELYVTSSCRSIRLPSLTRSACRTLASALERMRRWPQYNRFQRWRECISLLVTVLPHLTMHKGKKDDINDDLLEYNAQINNALTTFFVRSLLYGWKN